MHIHILGGTQYSHNNADLCTLYNFHILNHVYMIFLVDLTWRGYAEYRKLHDGPLSKKSFQGWVMRKGKDKPDFVWRNVQKNIRGHGRGRGGRGRGGRGRGGRGRGRQQLMKKTIIQYGGFQLAENATLRITHS